MTSCTVIVAAHNEEAVIQRTLDPLTELVDSGEIRLIVVCNGCSDGTAKRASVYPGVEVVELPTASKTAALREGDRLAAPGPRLYLDADVILTARAARDVFAALSSSAIAGRPPQIFETSSAGWVVRRWYGVRQSLPSIASALWGAGCYALSERGRGRFAEFPEIVSDDLFIDNLFTRDEITIVPTDPVLVKAPRYTADLVRILCRSYRTQSDVEATATVVSLGQRAQLNDLRGLLKREPLRILDVVLYVSIISYSRLRARLARQEATWERDVSSRLND